MLCVTESVELNKAKVKDFGGCVISNDDAIIKATEIWSPEECEEIWCVEYSSGIRIKYEANKDYIIGYFRYSKSLNTCDREINEETIIVINNKDKAIKKAQEYVTKLGNTFQVKEWQAKLIPVGSSNIHAKESELVHKWMIHGTYEYKGYECFGRGVFIDISPYSGELLAYTDNKIIIPDDLTVRITKEKAELIASKYVLDKHNYITKKEMTTSELIILNYNDLRSLSEMTDSCDVHLCWHVFYDKRYYEVFIDASTGDVGYSRY